MTHSARPAVALLALAACCLFPAVASAGTITGTVTDEISGEPVANVTVGAGPVGYGLRDYTRTAADGTYSIEEPEAGTYNVCFLPQPGMNALKRCWRDETAGFYGEAIDVPETGEVSGIDTALSPGTSVAGRVTDWGSQPLAGVCVTAWHPQSGGIGRVADTTTADDGTYTLVGLTPGSPTRVVFNESCVGGGATLPGFALQWYDRQDDYDTATAVTAARSETRAGVDGFLGPASIPPAGVAPAPQAAKCVVPRLRNRTFNSARARLAQAGCSIPKPLMRASKRLDRGRVLRSRPAARKKVRRGRRIQLFVSRGR